MIKCSETKNSKDNNYGADNAGNNKNKESKHNKKDHQSNNNYSINNISPLKCTYCRQDVNLTIKCFKNRIGRATKANQNF